VLIRVCFSALICDSQDSRHSGICDTQQDVPAVNVYIPMGMSYDSDEWTNTVRGRRAPLTGGIDLSSCAYLGLIAASIRARWECKCSWWSRDRSVSWTDWHGVLPAGCSSATPRLAAPMITNASWRYQEASVFLNGVSYYILTIIINGSNFCDNAHRLQIWMLCQNKSEFGTGQYFKCTYRLYLHYPLA
jgi:hypothetical protein